MDHVERKNTWLAKRDIELKNYKNEVLNQLESKYGEDFEVIGSIGQCLGLPADRWGVRSKDGSEAFLALGYLTLDGYEVSDSYVKPDVKYSFEEKLKRVVHLMEGEVKADIEVFTECSRDICRLNSRIILIIREKGAKDTVMRFCERISADELTASISWYAVNDTAFYGIKDFNIIKKTTLASGSAYVDRRHRISIYDDMECGFFDKYAAPLTHKQLERLCAIAYLDEVIENSKMEYLGKILRCMKVFGFVGGCEMTSGEWDYVIDDILSDAVLCRLRLVKSIDVTERNQTQYGDIMPGHRALCFVDPVNAAYVIFRGTSGDYEWYDNAEGMVLAETVQQRAALRFVTEAAEMGFTELTVAGHSKGGNKAQYAAIVCPSGMVSKCLSLDGQGFSEQFFIKNGSFQKAVVESKVKKAVE